MVRISHLFVYVRETVRCTETEGQRSSRNGIGLRVTLRDRVSVGRVVL